jgi:hypothetical protein
VLVDTDSASGPAEHLKELGKKGLEAGGATTAQANRIWLISRARVILNFLKNQCPEWDLQMGPAMGPAN